MLRAARAWARSPRWPAWRPPPRPSLHGRLHPLGPGKDSTTGHWELMGVVAPGAAATYPGRLPAEVVARLRAATGRGVLLQPAGTTGSRPSTTSASTTCATGELILYTSADSVLQIAAHVDVLRRGRAVRAVRARRARSWPAPHAVGRVIARPFTGAPGAFERTDGPQDFSVEPPGRRYLDELRDAGVAVHAVGKVARPVRRRGHRPAHPGATNAQALAATTALLRELDGGLVFTNLVETDQVYGHRKDVEGFHGALREIDAAVGGWLDAAAARTTCWS